MTATEHTCSARTQETCPTCGLEDTRDAFEGFEQGDVGPARFVVRCRECEALHPDQTDHDEDQCDECWEEELDVIAAQRAV